MAAKVERMRLGGLEVLVETVTVAGTEPTSAAGTAKDKAVEMFERAKATILAFAESTVEVVKRMAASAATRPKTVEVEFGLGFTARGNVVLTAGEATATVRVKLVYEVPARSGPESTGG